MILTRKEEPRVLVLGQVDRGQLTVGQAAEVLGRSERQVRRILAAYRKEGVAALAHGVVVESRPTALQMRCTGRWWRWHKRGMPG